jgi:hypothetical protein
LILRDATQGKFMKKRELLDLVEWRYKKILTYGWAHCFLDRHTDAFIYSMLHPQEDPRLQIPRVFLGAYLKLIKQHAVGVRPRLISNIDKTGCSDWEEQRRLLRVCFNCLDNRIPKEVFLFEILLRIVYVHIVSQYEQCIQYNSSQTSTTGHCRI